jgi:hypothetical protein
MLFLSKSFLRPFHRMWGEHCTCYHYDAEGVEGVYVHWYGYEIVSKCQIKK